MDLSISITSGLIIKVLAAWVGVLAIIVVMMGVYSGMLKRRIVRLKK